MYYEKNLVFGVSQIAKLAQVDGRSWTGSRRWTNGRWWTGGGRVVAGGHSEKIQNVIKKGTG